jgi:D-citramalate synthase
MNALAKIYKSKELQLPKLIDYAVRIPPGSSSDALCETIITWTNNEKNLKLEDWILIKQ